MTKALIVVDVQNDYFPGGAMELVGSEAAGAVVGQIQSKFRAESLPVINVQHIARGESATFFRPGTIGVEINDAAKPAEGETLVVKHYPNSFRETNLLAELQRIGAKDLVIVGMMTHMCIDTTVRAANDLGFNVTLVEDACATKDLTHNGQTTKAKDVQTAYLAGIDGSFATVVHSSSLL
jgi:nicotinamidase-related amidase